MSFCHCNCCKKARRKGLILGSRRMGYWMKKADGLVEYVVSSVSDYVPYHKFAKGRARKVKNELNWPRSSVE